MPKRTYVDAGVLLAVWKGGEEQASSAIGVLDDPERQIVVSDVLWLEVMPKPTFHGRHDEVDAFDAIFDKSEHLHWDLEVLRRAHRVATEHGISALDAIHAATALSAQVDEMVTAKKQTDGGLFGVTGLSVRSLVPR